MLQDVEAQQSREKKRINAQKVITQDNAKSVTDSAVLGYLGIY